MSFGGSNLVNEVPKDGFYWISALPNKKTKHYQKNKLDFFLYISVLHVSIISSNRSNLV